MTTEPDFISKDARIERLRKVIARAINQTGDMKPNHSARKVRLQLKEALELDDRMAGK